MTYLISEKVRQSRKNINLTIEQLAKKIGCSKSYISQLENGKTKPSLSMIGKLVKALDIPITDIFEGNLEEQDSPPPTAKGSAPSGTLFNHLVKKEGRRTITYPDGKILDQFLTRAVYQKKMQPILTFIEPGGESHSDETIEHPEETEEFLIVLKGKLDFDLAGEKICLQEGDSLYFDGALPHHWRNNGDQAAEVLFVWTPAVW